MEETRYLLGSTEVVESKHNYFIYEVSLYILTKNSVQSIGSKWYASPKLLNCKEATFAKLDKDRKVAKYVTLISVPRDYIEQNNLKIVENASRRKRSKHKSAGSK